MRGGTCVDCSTTEGVALDNLCDPCRLVRYPLPEGTDEQFRRTAVALGIRRTPNVEVAS